jgi:hypothetical protein
MGGIPLPSPVSPLHICDFGGQKGGTIPFTKYSQKILEKNFWKNFWEI